MCTTYTNGSKKGVGEKKINEKKKNRKKSWAYSIKQYK